MSPTSHHLKLTLILGSIAMVYSGGYAQLPEARITTVSPPGARAGETLTLSIAGSDLEDANLRFSEPSITAQRDEKDPKKFVANLPPSVPPGLYDVWAVGKYGASNPRRFQVGVLPEVDASIKASSREESQEITLPCIVRGLAQKQNLYWFKVAGIKGVALTFDCQARVLDSRMDPLIQLFDSSGRHLTSSRSRAVVWTPTQDGPLFLSLRDFLSNGGNEHFFRLYCGAGSDLNKQAPGQPLVFWRSSLPATPETETNHHAHPQKLCAPFEVQGEFYPEGDTDAFEFDAKKGEVWWVEVTSNRLGLPTNPRTVVERISKDKNGHDVFEDTVVLDDSPFFAGYPDFDGAHFDPIGKYEVKQDGVHRVTLRDINNTFAADHSRKYVLSVRKAAPDFALVFAVQTPTPNKAYKDFNGPQITVRGANVRPGQTIPFRVFAVRRDAFDGEIQLTVRGLPPGITTGPSIIGFGQKEGVLLLHASADAAPWTGSISVEGAARIGDVETKRTASLSTPIWESTVSEFVEPARNRFASDCMLSLIADNPFENSLRTEPTTFDAAANDKIKVSLFVDPPDGGRALVKAKPAGVAALEKAKEIEITPKDGKADYELDLAPLKLPSGRHQVWFRGEQKVKRDIKGKETEVTLVLCSNPLLITIKDNQK